MSEEQRNTVWRLARWKTNDFKNWLDDVDPDVIFFFSGDYSFMYDIAMFAADYLKKPIVVTCVDDYYIYNKNQNSLFGRLQHKRFLRRAKRLIDKAYCILTISDSMRDAYSELFGKPCKTLHTSVERKNFDLNPQASKVAYFGNLGYYRFEQLADIGRALKNAKLPAVDCIDVYSGETDPLLLENLNEENGVRFHGYIDVNQIPEKYAECIAIIHTESFDPVTRARTRYSVSTKIAESLMYAPCLIAYGPEEIASIKFGIRFEGNTDKQRAARKNSGERPKTCKTES